MMDAQHEVLTTEAASKPAPVQKDPKKQEAGRKGAAARQRKLEALKSELDAAKEAVYSANTGWPAASTDNNEHTSSASARRTEEANTHGPSVGWLVGISITIIAGAVLYSYRQPRASTTAGPASSKQASPVDKNTEVRNIFNME